MFLQKLCFIEGNSLFYSKYIFQTYFPCLYKTSNNRDFYSSHLIFFLQKGSFFQENYTQRTILKLLSIRLQNSFLRDQRCEDESRIAVTFKMKPFMTLVHSCQLLLLSQRAPPQTLQQLQIRHYRADIPYNSCKIYKY